MWVKASMRSFAHSAMKSPYSFSRWRMSLTLSSRRVSVFWVIQAVATVADPPTSEPSTPDMAAMRFVSMAIPPVVHRPNRRWRLCRNVHRRIRGRGAMPPAALRASLACP